MRLASIDGSFLDLRIVGYQFPGTVGDGSGRGWDANWLVIRGEVNDGGRISAFQDPCLTTWEARQVAEWLRGVATGVLPAEPYEDDNDVRLQVFTEPNIALNLAERSDTHVQIRVYLSFEAQPAWVAAAEGGGIFDYFVGLTVPIEGVEAAASQFDTEVDRFPQR